MPSKRQMAIYQAKQYLLFNPLFLDTETTGLGPDDEIVEVAVFDFEGNMIFESLVKPAKRIPQEAISIHGITNEMVVSAPAWSHVWDEFEKTISGRYVGIYNADFDERMLNQSNRLAGIVSNSRFRFFCIMKLYADYYQYGGGRYQKLDAAGRQMGIPLPNSHRAADDTLLALAVFKKIVDSLG